MKILQEKLQELKNKYGLIGLKADLESVGASYDDVDMLSLIAKELSLEMTVKIGGVGAGNDLNFLSKKNVDNIVAPMVESVYAVEKFVDTAKIFGHKNTKLYINIETVEAIKNFDKIVNSKSMEYIYGIVFGRSDLALSLGLKKTNVDSDLILKTVLSFGKKAYQKRKDIIVGGTLRPESINFIKTLNKEFALKCETKYLIFNAEKVNDNSIVKALSAEDYWRKQKTQFTNNKKSNIQEQKLDWLAVH